MFNPSSSRLRPLRARVLPTVLPNALCFLSSMAIMVLELVAGRLVAHQVGSSQYTWTSIIAIILAGMSLGNWLGGRLADGPEPSRLLERLFLVAALAVQMPIPLDMAIRGLEPHALSIVLNHPEGSSHLWGLAVLSLMTVVFLVPAVGLGLLSPVLARMALDAEKQTGKAIGTIYSWGAIGAILGVVLSGFVLVSLFSVKTILLGVSGVMLLLWAVLRVSHWRGWLPTSSAETSSTPPIDAESSPAPSPIDPDDLPTKQDSLGLHPYVIITLSSFILMVLEMVAGRMVSRNVGTSIYTWTTVIGVIFAGMSLGNWMGGRLASDPPFGWSLPRLTSRLLVLCSLTTILALWTNPALDAVMNPELWPGGGNEISGTLGFSERSYKLLAAENLPDELLQALRALNPRGDTETRLRSQLVADIPPELLGNHLNTLMAHARLDGPVIRAIREEGVPDALIEGLRPTLNRVYLRGLDYELERLLVKAGLTEPYSYEERNDFLYRIQARTWRPTLFVFPMRLFFAIVLVFGLPALTLGCVSPVVAAMALEHARARGQTMGNVYAWGAWGSIVGTALAGFFLVRWFGNSLLLCLCALVLAGLGTLVLVTTRVSTGARTRSRMALTALILLLIPTLPPLAQLGEPTGLDPVPHPHFEVQPTSTRPLLESFALGLDGFLMTRNEDLGINRVDSNYQSIRVGRADAKNPAPGVELRKLSLDRLIHGYLLLKMPDKTQPFEYSKAQFDASHLAYDYEIAYALVTGRAQLERFEPDPARPGHWLTPPLMSLSLGGGTYTFPRYLLETFEGRTHTVQPGETLDGLITRYYGLKQGSESHRELRERLLRAQKLPRAQSSSDALAPGTPLTFPTFADVVELDPLVTAINYSRFAMPTHDQEPRLKTWNYDARNFVEALTSAGWTGRYDVIYGDAFNHYSVPYHLSTLEFNRQVKGLLKPGGVFVANLIDRYNKCRFLSAYITTLQQLYRHVRVVVHRDRTQRYGRETFVIMASDAPIDLEWAGGLPASLMAGVENLGLEALDVASSGQDPALVQRVRAGLMADPEGFYSKLLKRQQIDLQLVSVPSDASALVQLEKDDADGLRIRDYEALPPEYVQRELVETGRMPALSGFLQELLPLRLLLGAPVAEFRVEDAGLTRLAEKDPPREVLDAARTLQGQPFDDVEALLNALAAALSPEHFAQYQHVLVKAFRVQLSARPPLVLTDAYAPVDELLAPLFEDPTSH